MIPQRGELRAGEWRAQVESCRPSRSSARVDGIGKRISRETLIAVKRLFNTQSTPLLFSLCDRSRHPEHTAFSTFFFLVRKTASD